MAGDESEQQRSFKVQDRRRFSSTGEAREDAATGEEPATAAGDTSAPQASPTGSTDGPRAERPPAITFSTFVISLSTQALAHLGEIPDPVDAVMRIDLDGARQIIDILGILGEKTRGNLDAAESSLLDHALYDLRMRYVERAQGR